LGSESFENVANFCVRLPFTSVDRQATPTFLKYLKPSYSGQNCEAGSSFIQNVIAHAVTSTASYPSPNPKEITAYT
jgi:hypothetical protein